MTAQQEDTIIHEFLAQFMMSLDHPRQVSDIAERYGVKYHAPVLLDRLLEEGLVTKVSPDYGYFLVKLTPFGVSTVRHTGGYLGYLSEIENRRIAKQQQEQELAQATITAANATVSAARAAWVAAGFSLLSIAISVFALYQTNQLDEAQKQITTLQQQVKRLSIAH